MKKIHVLLFAAICSIFGASTIFAQEYSQNLFNAEQKLYALGFTEVGEPDGINDSATTFAVGAFQKVYGFEIDGALTQQVFDRLMLEEENSLEEKFDAAVIKMNSLRAYNLSSGESSDFSFEFGDDFSTVFITQKLEIDGELIENWGFVKEEEEENWKTAQFFHFGKESKLLLMENHEKDNEEYSTVFYSEGTFYSLSDGNLLETKDGPWIEFYNILGSHYKSEI